MNIIVSKNVNEFQKKEKLTKEDISIIKYQLRSRYVISLLIFMIFSVIAFVIAYEISKETGSSRVEMMILLLIVSTLISFLIFQF